MFRQVINSNEPPIVNRENNNFLTLLRGCERFALQKIWHSRPSEQCPVEKLPPLARGARQKTRKILAIRGGSDNLWLKVVQSGIKW